jgi:hypothetical protein
MAFRGQFEISLRPAVGSVIGFRRAYLFLEMAQDAITKQDLFAGGLFRLVA